jgi:flavin reductase (DIM6/NTAB) family NADH-FMN oxidoreductase RutF
MSEVANGPDEVLREMVYGVYIVTAQGTNGEHGCTASWVMQVSKRPPLLAVALRKGSVSEQAVTHAGAFAVNLISADNIDLAERFFTPTDRFNNPPSLEFSRGLMDLPLLDEAIGWLECQTHQRLEIGDHIVFIGEVQGGRMRADDIPMTTLDSGLGYGGLGKRTL